VVQKFTQSVTDLVGELVGPSPCERKVVLRNRLVLRGKTVRAPELSPRDVHPDDPPALVENRETRVRDVRTSRRRAHTN